MKSAKLTKFAEFQRDENGKVTRILPGEFRFDDDPVPEIGDDQVLLRILSFGICGSDIQVYHGQHPAVTPEKLPRVLGHEVSCVVEKLGANVSGYTVGEKVAVEPQVFCGECWPCKMGRFNVCEHIEVIGIHRDGFNCEYYACDARYLHKVPQDMSVDLLTIVEPLAVGVSSVKRSTLYKGGNVVVIGAGTIGNCVAQAAKGLGAGAVMVTDINQDKLDYALECGMDFAVNTAKKPLKEAIDEAFGVRKADVIIDTAAVPAIFQNTIDIARPASEIIQTGSYKIPVNFFIPSLQRREISYIGHFMYVREDYQDAIRLLYEGKINTDKLISHRWDFDQLPEAYHFADEHPFDFMKMIVKVTDL